MRRLSSEGLLKPVFLSLLFIFFSVSSACAEGEGIPFQDSSENSVSIVTMASDSSKPFTPGDKMTIRIEVAYTLLQPRGFVGLVVKRSGEAGETLGSAKKDISKGQRTISLEASFQIPKDAKGIEIYTPLFLEGANSSVAVDGRVLDFKEQTKFLDRMKKEEKGK